MPELPEVETVRRGIEPHLRGRRFHQINIYQPQLRWPVDRNLSANLKGQTVDSVKRRGKYLLVGTGKGHLILHLGMSGKLLLTKCTTARNTHDHIDFIFAGRDKLTLRLNDPRRFGSVHWHKLAEQHPLLANLGPEPLGPQFNAASFHAALRGRGSAIKQVLMNHTVVVGIGNIYANEALFMAGIHPGRAANRISYDRISNLVATVRKVLRHAIRCGGSTLKDFNNASGNPGYFQMNFLVYGREGLPCKKCSVTQVRILRIGGRASYYCPRCQR
ncbi:MAG: bifunctional DNA-formamidopyrimidine glycosylase/DNA-(apurinic or apyrimidinic site) lyase [Candidatus Porifericomitaceae bacterium WSBS_2022_MAG_OTU9]